jgi:hypothetical protein
LKFLKELLILLPVMNGKKRIMARWFIIAGIILIAVGVVLYFARRFTLVWQATRRYPDRERTQQGVYIYHLHGAGQHHPNHSGEPYQVAD